MLIVSLQHGYMSCSYNGFFEVSAWGVILCEFITNCCTIAGVLFLYPINVQPFLLTLGILSYDLQHQICYASGLGLTILHQYKFIPPTASPWWSGSVTSMFFSTKSYVDIYSTSCMGHSTICNNNVLNNDTVGYTVGN
jgi:hypothetical protein